MRNHGSIFSFVISHISTEIKKLQEEENNMWTNNLKLWKVIGVIVGIHGQRISGKKLKSWIEKQRLILGGNLITKKEARSIAQDVENKLKNSAFNTPGTEVGYDIYDFNIDGTKYNVFAYFGKKSDGTARWYSVYAGLERECGDIIWADYDSSTAHLRTDELTNAIYKLGNMYTRNKNLQEIKKELK